VVAQVAVVGPAVDWIGETAVLFAGLFLNVVGFWLVVLAVDFWTLTATICVQGAGMACVQTAIPSMISKKAGSRQGTLMGVRTGLENASRVAGPIVGGRVYEVNPAYPFWTGSLTYALCIVIGGVIYMLRSNMKRSKLTLTPMS
jgi:DHA1 family multidrug resistance protein-like MFS transporter